MTLTAGVTYTYDGDGKRVQKSSGKLYWHGMGSDPLDETDLAGSTSNASFFEYVFFDGKRIARRDSTNAVNYYFSDHLGTARIVSNSSGTVLDDSDFYPFGGERAVISSSGNHYKFTSKERDVESGLDSFGARHYGSALGRFQSADIFNNKLIVQPQDLNLYAYTINNPLRYYDPDGREWKENLLRLVGAFTIKGSVGIGAAARQEGIGTGFKGKAEVKASGELNTEKGATFKVTTEVGGELSVGGKKFGTTETATHASLTVHPNGSVDAQTKPTTEVTVNGKSTSSSGTSSGASSNGEFTVFAVETTVVVPIGAGAVPVTEGSELSVNVKEAGDALHGLAADISSMFSNPGAPPPPAPPAPPTSPAAAPATCNGSGCGHTGGPS